jgi:TolB-like protein/Tfp pilus assembly protein PilF
MAIWTSEIKELEKLYESLKGQLPDLQKELERLIRADDENMILLYSRRCLEVIITDLCECELKRPRKTEPLQGIIDKLHKEEKVPSHIIASMHGLNELSTYGAHPKDFDPKQVRTTLINLETVIEWYLKHKEGGAKVVARSTEGIRQEVKSTEDVKKRTQIPRKRLTSFIIGSILLIVIVIAVLFFTKIIGSGKQIEELEKSIAVLPFFNDSPNDSTTYFMDGVMEEILTNLQTIKDIRVISRTSVEQYRKQAKSIPEIAKKLGVNYIVEGSGQKSGNKFRLRVQLIRASKESHLWAKSYEYDNPEAKDYFSIQSQIAQAIATQLEVAITTKEKQLIEKTHTKNLEAYDAYLKGLFFYEKGNIKNENENAILWFKEAIKFDSTFVLPWTYLSMCYWRLNLTYTADSPEFKEAKRTAERALKLDSASGIAIVNMAEILDNEYDFEGAEKKIKLALKINPDDQYILRNAGRFYTKLGRKDESILLCTQALKKDPNNATTLDYLALAYFYASQLTEAWATLKKYHELGYRGQHMLYYEILLHDGNIDKIINEPSYEQDDKFHNVALAAANFKLGHKNVAENLCAQLEEESIIDFAYWIAFAYAYGDEPEKVCTWLERSYASKEIQLTYIGVDPAFSKFRNEPRVKELINKMKFPI